MDSHLFTTPEELEKQLGVGVRHVRLQQRLTQAELATKANVSLSSVKYLETGRGSSLSTVVRVARALGRSDWLGAFAPAEPAYSPLAALRARTEKEHNTQKRVRHSARDISRSR